MEQMRILTKKLFSKTADDGMSFDGAIVAGFCCWKSGLIISCVHGRNLFKPSITKPGAIQYI